MNRFTLITEDNAKSLGLSDDKINLYKKMGAFNKQLYNIPLTESPKCGTIDSDEKMDEVTIVSEKITCKNCGTSFEQEFLKNKDSLDKCPMCHEWFEDTKTCKACNTTFKRDVLEKSDDKDVCPMCGARWDMKSQEDIENEILAQADERIIVHEIVNAHGQCEGHINLHCTHCKGKSTTMPIGFSELETISEKYVILKNNFHTKCEYCGHVATGVLKVKLDTLESLIENPYTHVPKCPHCHSIEIEKISQGSKIGKALAIGVFAIPDIGKQYRCKICKYKW